MADIKLKNKVGEEVPYFGISAVSIKNNSGSGSTIFVDASDADATAATILNGKTAYVGTSKVTGTIPTKTEADVTSTSGVVTIPAGYYASQVQKQGDPSGDATAEAGDILASKTAYSKGVKLTGTIPTQTASGNASLNDTTTTKSYPAGYYPNAHGATHATVNIPDPTMSFADGKVTASGSWTKGFTTDNSYTKDYTVTLDNAKTVTGNASLNNAATTGVEYTEDSSAATVIPAEGALYINAGYVPNTKITLSHLIPDPETGKTNVGAAQMRTGYVAFDGEGKKIVGTMADVTPTFTGGAPTLTAKSNTISTNMSTTTSSDYYIDASASAKATRTAVTYNGVATGYVDKASGTTASAAATEANAETISATRVYVSKAALGVSGSVTTSGSGSVNPGTNTISKNSNTNVSTGTVTTTKPSSGYYVAVDASTAQNTGTISVSGTGTASASVSSAGYAPATLTGSGSVSGSGSASVTVPAKSASTTYVPITSGSATTPATTKQQSAPTFSKSGNVITASVAATSVSVTPTVSAGYVSSGTAGTVTMSANSATYTIPTQTKTATTNGTVSADDGKYLTSVSVSLPEYDGSLMSVIGGKIFYVDTTASGATYTFYDASMNVITDQTVTGLANAVYYEKTGTSSTDKFYVVATDSSDTTYGGIKYTTKYWGYFGQTTGATTDSIGSGKSNTNSILAISDTSYYSDDSIFKWIKELRDSSYNGCSDWFIGSKTEHEQLRTSGKTSIYSAEYVWSSVDYNSNYAYSWYYNDSSWYDDFKLTSCVGLALRAF